MRRFAIPMVISAAVTAWLAQLDTGAHASTLSASTRTASQKGMLR